MSETALSFVRVGDWITISDGGVERTIPAWWMDWMPRFAREPSTPVGAVPVEVVESGWVIGHKMIRADVRTVPPGPYYLLPRTTGEAE